MLTDSSRFFILRSKKERQEKNMVYAFMADGCEEVEALAVIDLLRRAGEEVELVSIHNKDMTQGSHGIGIKNDVMLKDIFVVCQ